ncbi:MAG: nitrilase-related carbon-nitrogen hydrolase, partial [Pseudomonadota bacterium]
MRLALLQPRSPAGDAEAGLEVLDRALAVAAAAGADMMVGPELFLPGYNHEPMAADPGWPDRLAGLARAQGVGLTVGLALADGDRLLNAALAFGPDGAELARYAKIQLWGAREAGHFAPGDRIAAFDFAGRRIGLAICYDVEFPEIVRAYAKAGADLILVPTGNPAPYDGVSRFVVPATANANALSIAYANYCGEERGAAYAGMSVVVGPDGEALATAGLAPATLIVDLPEKSDPSLRPLSTQVEDLRF